MQNSYWMYVTYITTLFQPMKITVSKEIFFLILNLFLSLILHSQILENISFFCMGVSYPQKHDFFRFSEYAQFGQIKKDVFIFKIINRECFSLFVLLIIYWNYIDNFILYKRIFTHIIEFIFLIKKNWRSLFHCSSG